MSLTNKKYFLLDYNAKNDEALLAALCMNNPGLGVRKILQMFGLKKALEFITPRELRVLFASFNPRNLQRIMADAKQVKLPNVNSPLGVIREQIAKFKACKI